MARSLTGVDTIRLLRRVVAPAALGGVVTPNRRRWPGLVRRNAIGRTHRHLQDVRRKYGPRVRWWFLTSTWLVLDGDGIDNVLQAGKEPPPNNFADPFIKRRPPSCFAPASVIVSGGPEWQARRHYNEDVLALGKRHPDAGSFLPIIDQEVEHLFAGEPRVLGWDDFSRLAARISQGIIFGRGAFDEDFDHHLHRLVTWSNRWLRAPCHFRPFARHIEDGFTRAPNASLLGKAGAACKAPGSAGPGASLEPVGQAAFWCFVLKDAIALHTSRTLALITAAADELREGLTTEVVQGRSPDDIERMSLLDACIREQLRLWTPVPLLARRAAHPFALDDGREIRPGQTLLLHVGFYHRDPDVFGANADRFAPERLRNGLPQPPLYIFSRHRQSCAGESLAMFVVKAVLSAILRRGSVESLTRPVDVNAVPASIDQFQLRFWCRRHPAA